jgi:hypothetical protein
MAQSHYQFVGRGGDGTLTAPEASPAEEPLRALSEARSFLTSHQACEAVEIWRDDHLVATLGRRMAHGF